ncbi:T9SS C-terminal target domain-containing protein [Candidatus Marinimicrobia bacterium PRS2]|nr:T9SS C-terminal target domain-containing protein [Candidatus Marinimicrobia bacterium PRS2]
MKYFHILLLLGINYSTILLSQSIEIPNNMMNIQNTHNIPIFIYNVSELESIQLKIEYDESIVVAEDIIENPVGILDAGYTFTPNLTEPGIINLAIVSNSANIFSGSGMVAQITFKSIGNLGEFSYLTILDAQINSDWQISAVDGSIEIILDELMITGQDNSGIGANHVITLGMCDECADEWKFGEDEDDYPDPPSGEYTNINFYQLDWFGQEDENGNVCNQIEFSTNFRSQHSIRELTSWGIKGSTGGGLSSDIDINLSWDSDILNSTSDNFKIFIYVGDTGYNMQVINNINVSQSDLTLNENNEPNIWVMLGGCADTGETEIYYHDFDGDGLGGGITAQYCSGYEPDDWVTNSDDMDDNCYSNVYDCVDECDGILEYDCLGVCGGYAITDACDVCDSDNNNNNQCNDCNFDPNGGAILDNCGNCILEGENTTCEMDCTGNWGGSTIHDDCDICGGNQIDGDLDDDGDICETECTEDLDCNGDCGGIATTDDCDICVGGNSGQIACIQDCNGIWGGNFTIDECGVCDSNPNNDNEQCLDCNGNVNGDYELDNCGVCDNDSSNDCQLDCNNEWGGGASIDNCQICSGGSTGLILCEQDCNGDWGGYAFWDECDVCDSDNTNNNQCFDCNFDPNGGAIIDNCNECILAGEVSSCILGCDGYWNNNGLEMKYDECEVCMGNNSSCTDCSGDVNGAAQIDACETCAGGNSGVDPCPIDCLDVPNGIAIEDHCGTCDSDPLNDCILDCNGDWGGSAEIDENCPICFGGTTGLEPCIEDCNGVWGGNFEDDLCGICDADIENNDQCVDCNGTVDGLAYLDNCGNCVEDASDLSYECEPDCDGIYGGNHPPTFTCQNGDIACNFDACFDLGNDDFPLPQRFDINRIYPNPFNPQATIDFEVSEPTLVQLNIYNLKGQKVDVLINAFTLPGYYSVIWNGTNHPSGIYFVILQSSNSIVKQKMMLIK